MSAPSTSSLQVELLSRDTHVKYGCFTFFCSLCSTLAPMGPNTEFTHELHSLLCMCCKSSSKRTQHCWPTTPNAVGCLIHVASVCTPCCMLLRIVGVVAQSLKQVKRLATCKRAQKLPTLLGAVASVCT